jgi:hypothetical protein
MMGMGTKVVRCGNPECPERPVLPDQPPWDREACPACGSTSRLVEITVHAGVAMRSTAAAPEAQTVTGSASLEAVASIRAEAEVIRKEAGIRLAFPRALATHEVLVRFCELSERMDAPCLIELVDPESRTVLASGAGLSPAEALAAMFSRMLPTFSSEWVDEGEQPALPDDDGDF